MTLLDTIRAHGRHRRLSPAELYTKVGRLERELAERDSLLLATATELGQLVGERNQLQADLDAAGIELSGEREDHAEAVARIEARHTETVDEMQQQIDDLTRRLEVQVLAEAAASQTQEIDAREIQERFADGPVVSLHHSPQAVTQPGQTAWGAAREQEVEA